MDQPASLPIQNDSGSAPGLAAFNMAGWNCGEPKLEGSSVSDLGRRTVIALLGGAAASFFWPFVPRAQPSSGRMPHIAYLGALSPTTLDPRQIEQFKVGLAENGLVPDRTVTVDYLWAEGSPDRLRQLATELAGSDVDVIVTAGPQLVRALVEARTRAPIVFAILNDPIGDGFVQTLARPGGNVTGLSMAGSNLESKRLEVLKDAAPALRKVMILHDPSMGSIGLDEVSTAVHALRLEQFLVETSDADSFEAAFADAAQQGVNGMATMASPYLNFQRKRLIELAARHRLPSIWESSGYVRDGGLLSYGPSFADMYRRSAGYVAKILNGAKPSDLPVQQPVTFELAINMQAAKALGLELPPTLLARADEVIE
jgi:putative ABC transport system substrate-binding protein